MTGSTIMISVPTITIAKLEDVPPQISAPEEPVAAVLMHMLGDLTGRTLLVFPQADGASRLAELMLRRPGGLATELGELEQSAIKEAGQHPQRRVHERAERLHGHHAAAVAAEPRDRHVDARC